MKNRRKGMQKNAAVICLTGVMILNFAGCGPSGEKAALWPGCGRAALLLEPGTKIEAAQTEAEDSFAIQVYKIAKDHYFISVNGREDWAGGLDWSVHCDEKGKIIAIDILTSEEKTGAAED
jgi:hypothetical protein